jgi:hypothetical protein
VNHLVLSGTNNIVPSGTRSSCYRGPESIETCCLTTAYAGRNFTNLESFGFFLTDRAFFASVDNRSFAPRDASPLTCSFARQVAKQRSHCVQPVSGFAKAGPRSIASAPRCWIEIRPFQCSAALAPQLHRRWLDGLNPKGSMHE